jgi:hypothetical protein
MSGVMEFSEALKQREREKMLTQLDQMQAVMSRQIRSEPRKWKPILRDLLRFKARLLGYSRAWADQQLDELFGKYS